MVYKSKLSADGDVRSDLNIARSLLAKAIEGENWGLVVALAGTVARLLKSCIQSETEISGELITPETQRLFVERLVRVTAENLRQQGIPESEIAVAIDRVCKRLGNTSTKERIENNE